MDIERALSAIEDMLPAAASRLIDPAEKDFQKNPDSRAEHSPEWHQYGIITHSVKFKEYIETQVPGLLDQLGIADAASKILQEEVDGVRKSDLLRAASLLHDVGKFTARSFQERDGHMMATFRGHERDSGRLIREDLEGELSELSFTGAQIEYIATCATHHFELGKVRNTARDNGGYTMAFAQSEAFKEAAQEIIDANHNIALEIGLMFLADSFSKAEITARLGTDEEIDNQQEELKQKIKEEGRDPRLINQALQQPVNVAIGMQYLRLWAASAALV